MCGGSPLPKDQARQLALGNLNPNTLEVMDRYAPPPGEGPFDNLLQAQPAVRLSPFSPAPPPPTTTAEDVGEGTATALWDDFMQSPLVGRMSAAELLAPPTPDVDDGTCRLRTVGPQHGVVAHCYYSLSVVAEGTHRLSAVAGRVVRCANGAGKHRQAAGAGIAPLFADAAHVGSQGLQRRGGGTRPHHDGQRLAIFAHDGYLRLRRWDRSIATRCPNTAVPRAWSLAAAELQ